MFQDFFLLFDNFSALFLFFLVLVVEAGIPIPIPYDILILVAGYRKVDFFLIALAVVLGNLIGSTILYYFSFHFGHPFLHKGSQFLGISKSRLKMVEHWFNRWGGLAIILARLIPGARFAATCISGVFSLSYFKVFAPNLLVGSILWVTSYWLIGAIVGEGVQLAWQILGVWSAILTILIIGLICFIIFRVYHRLNGKRPRVN